MDDALFVLDLLRGITKVLSCGSVMEKYNVDSPRLSFVSLRSIVR